MLATAWVWVVMAEEDRETGGGAVLSVVSSSEEQERLLMWLVSVTELSDGRVLGTNNKKGLIINFT